MAINITDVWFRTTMSLADIAQRLNLIDTSEDCESDWIWIIGTMRDVMLDITRSRTQQASKMFTRVFVLNGSFTEWSLAELVKRLQAFIKSPIYVGRWIYQSGNEYDFIVDQEFGLADIVQFSN